MRKFTLLFMVLLGVVGTRAKTVTTVTTLWEDTYSDHIQISKDVLCAGTITVYMSWQGSEDTHVRAYYKKNNSDWTESTFSDNGGTIEDWKWQNNGTESYEFTIAESDMNILNDNTTDTGSRGILYIGSADKTKMTISKITLTTTATKTETGTTSIYNGSHDLASWNGLQLTTGYLENKLATAKIGDLLRVTYTSDESGQINFCNSSWQTLENGSKNVTTTASAATVEFEITNVTVLESIQQNGLVLNGTNAVITALDLLTYADSYDAVAITIGSEGVATFSNGGKNVQISACGDVRAYYASAVEKGLVRLTELTGCIPANQGVMVYGNEGTYTVPVGSENWPDIKTNYLKATGDYSQDVAASTEGKFHYIFAKDNNEGTIGFFKLTADHTLGAHKAYLETTDDITPTTNNARVALVFDDDMTTSIRDVHRQTVADGTCYTISGQRVEQPTKGLYIVNGKKVIIK